MGTWIGTARSNYFRVKDPEAFRVWAESLGLDVFDRIDHQRERRYCIAAAEGDGWPLSTGRGEDWRKIDFIAELAQHVKPGDIVVCTEAGAEKRRFITGEAVAFRVGFAGVERLKISLNDIYDLAEREWGMRPNEAEY